ncbi:dnaJ protein P58IPK homolog B-like [Henckelia pumila]|uniref:dnaJ protein P58IPK homolog B-like n=1 Tax=Henckelia pumila TaxID=405737 RepID=UPI003C6DD506
MNVIFLSTDYLNGLNHCLMLESLSDVVLQAKLLKARLLITSKDYSSVISEAGYILKEEDDNLEALILRGCAYYYLANHDVATRHYQLGLRLDPEHGELKKAYFGLKNLIKKTKNDNASKGKLRLAVEEYKSAIALDPNHTAHNVNLHLGLCKVLVKLGRGQDARGEAKLVIEDWEGDVADLKSAYEKSPQRYGSFLDVAAYQRRKFMKYQISSNRIRRIADRGFPASIC